MVNAVIKTFLERETEAWLSGGGDPLTLGGGDFSAGGWNVPGLRNHKSKGAATNSSTVCVGVSAGVWVRWESLGLVSLTIELKLKG